jgi:hypothetical protein
MRSTVLSLTVIAALAAGFFAGRHLPSANRNGRGGESDGDVSGSTGTDASPTASARGDPRGEKPFDGTAAELMKLANNETDYEQLGMKLTRILMTLSGPKLAKLVSEIDYSQNVSWQANRAREMLVRLWAEKDAGAAVRWAAQLPKSIRGDQLNRALDVWAKSDPDKALAFARNIPDKYDRENAVAAVLGVMAVEDPRKALQMVKFAGKNSNAHSAIFAVWARRDGAGAFAAAAGLADPRERRSAFNSVFGAWAEDDPRAAHAAALGLKDAESRQDACNSIFGTWGRKDPVAACAAAREMPPGVQRRNALSQLFSIWAGHDPQGALQAANDLPKSERQQAYGNLIYSWASNDGAGALAWAKSIPRSEGGDSLVNSALSCLAQRDPDAAIHEWSQLPPRLRLSQVYEVTSHFATSDPQAALTWAKSLERAPERHAALGALLGQMGPHESDDVMKLLPLLPAGQFRQNAVTQLFNSWTSYDADAALQLLKELPEADRQACLRNDNGLSNLISSDPERVAKLLGELGGPLADNNQYQYTASQLAEADPAAAIRWAESLESPGARKAAIAGACANWAERDPAAALAAAQNLQDPHLQKEFARTVLSTWAANDPEAVWKWAGAGEGELQQYAVLRGVATKASEDPAGSAQILAQMLGKLPADAGGTTKSEMADVASQLAGEWFAQDMGKAREWVEQLPQGDVQDRALEGMAGSWVNIDPLAASEWMRSLPAGKGRDAAVGRLVGAICQGDPERAFAWASSVGDADRREELMRSAVDIWGNADKAAARTAVQQSPALTEEARRKLLDRIKE